MKPFLFFCGPTRSVSSAMFSASLLLGALALTGCGGMASLPDTIISPPAATSNPIQGSVFGGHAPIVGAHVYILQAGTGGYASGSTNRMTSGSAGSDGNGNYALTAADGSFNLTGDYTCTTGLPVYIAATAGQTATNIGGSNYSTTPLTIASATAINLAPSLWELIFTANNLLYPGQEVVFSGLRATGGWSSLGLGTHAVAAATTTTFTLIISSGTTFSGSTTGTATPQSAINPAIANLAVLGNCPSTGNFSTSGTGSDVISYVYINEVSTAAAAYAFSGFGSGPFNIGYPSGDALAKTGIQNAANNAAALYNIEGAYLSTTFAGEGHIANPTTPAGNGVAPQATLDTLGNILASCVDSPNLTNSATNPDVSGASDNCSGLFTYATSNGVPFGSPSGVGTIPTDTATAAFNIAHNPAGNAAYSSAFMTGIYALQGAQITPFSPYLPAQPNDFTLGIQYTAGLNPGTPYSPLDGPEAVSVDASGNFWFTTQPTPSFSSGYLVEDSPVGVKLYDNYNSGWTYGDVAIDSHGDAWTGNQGHYVLATEIVPPSGTITTYTLKLQGSSYTYAQGVTADGSGYVFVPHGPTTQPPGLPSSDNDQTLSELDSAGVVNAGSTGNMAASFSAGAYMTHGAIDSSHDIWFTSNNGNDIARVNSSTGAAITGFPLNTSTATTACPSTIATTITNPEQPAIDASGNAWIPLYDNGAGSTVIEVTPSAACTVYTVGTGPFGATVDGANNLWVSNKAGDSITEINTATGTVVSPSTNYTVGGLLSGPEGVAVDLSGDLIITSFTGNSVVEVIGAATPTYLPLGVAAANNKLGAKP
jgi:hypothetical protein